MHDSRTNKKISIAAETNKDFHSSLNLNNLSEKLVLENGRDTINYKKHLFCVGELVRQAPIVSRCSSRSRMD